MSDSLQPFGLQPASLLPPQDSQSKNTGEGSHFLLLRISLRPGYPTLQANSLPSEPPGISKDSTKEYPLLWGIFLTQGVNPSLLDCRQTLNLLSHQEISRPSTATYIQQDPVTQAQAKLGERRVSLEKQAVLQPRL